MLAFLLALVSAIAVPTKPAKYVTDNARVLDAARASALNDKLAQFERDTSNQILVYVDNKLPPGTTIEQFGSEAIHQWGVGQKGKDNGAVLFIFTDDHKMRIEVGYGLESSLTDAKSRQITSTIIKPRLKAGDFTGGAEQGVDAMLAAARGEGLKGSGQTVRETRRSTSPVQTRSASKFGFGEVIGVLALFVLLPVGIIVLIIVLIVRGRRGMTSGSPMTTTYIPDVPDTSDSSSSSSWSSSSSSDFSSSSSSDSGSSSSDSGFDGGGGDSGGGGASDSW